MATKKIKLPKDLQGNEYYPATTTDAVVHPERKESVTVIVDTLATEVNELKSDLIENDEKINEIDRNKVDRDDNAPKLTAGFANNLVGRGDATKEEISFRPSGGDTSIEDGTARIDRVKGSTVVWNQRDNYSDREIVLASGLTLTFSDNILTLNGTASKKDTFFGVSYGFKAVPKDHKVYGYIKASGGFEGNASSNVTHDIRGGSDTTSLNKGGQKEVVGYASEYCYFRIPFNEGDTFTDYKISSKLIDLTLMFGEGNEPTTIEDFKKKMPLGIDEYAYNEGELISTNVEGLKSVGFNLFNGVLERGRLMNGYPSIGDSMLYSPEYYRILPNAQMYARIDKYNDNSVFFYPSFYDSQKNYISAFESINAKVFTTPSNAAYLRFFLYESRGNVLPLDYGQHVCIHLVHTGYRNGEYEPYKEFRRSIPIKDIKDNDGNQLFPNGLLSAGSVYDEITATKAIKRIGVVDLGTLNWTASPTSSDGVYRMRSNEFSSMRSNSITSNAPNIVADKYLTSSPDWNYQSNESITVSGIRVLVYDKNFNTGDSAASFKSAMQGVMLYYELAEPIEVDLEEPLNLDYEVSDFGTEEVISSEPTTPMKADIIYQFNAVDRIRDNSRHTAEADKKLLEYENRISALEAMIANSTREGDEVLE